MKTSLKALTMLFVSVLLFACAGGKWWAKYNPVMIANTPSATIVSLSPGDFRPGGGMYKVKTLPSKLPPRFFEDLSTIKDKIFRTNIDLSFVSKFKDRWKEGIRKGIEKNGNAIIIFNTRPRDYIHVAFHIDTQDEKEKFFGFMRKVSKRKYEEVSAYDPDGSKQLLQVYANGVSSRKTYGIIALFDEKGIDYFWFDASKTGHKSFKY